MHRFADARDIRMCARARFSNDRAAIISPCNSLIISTSRQILNYITNHTRRDEILKAVKYNDRSKLLLRTPFAAQIIKSFFFTDQKKDVRF